MPNRDTVAPVWEHMQKVFYPERDTCILFITDIAWTEGLAHIIELDHMG